MKFPEGLPPTTVANLTQMHVRFPPGADPAELVAVHPTQIYETVLMMLAFVWLWRLRDRPHAIGWRVGVYPPLAGAGGVFGGVGRAEEGPAPRAVPPAPADSGPGGGAR